MNVLVVDVESHPAASKIARLCNRSVSKEQAQDIRSIPLGTSSPEKLSDS
jgi:hypothetical protein